MVLSVTIIILQIRLQMYIHIFIFQIKKQQWFYLSNTFWKDLISKNKKIKYIIKKVTINPCLSPSKWIIG